ncbi:MAG: Sugar kinase [Acidobacteriota bacterium]|nr:Sugar kinase [Acidobacteriota bacterium]
MRPPAFVPIPEDRLHGLVDAMRGQPVLMLVDLVVDRFLSGTPKRISREAPVLILRYAGESLAPGGGANAVANVTALGGRPLPLGLVGDDDSGRDLLAALADRGISTAAILVRPGYRTPTKTRILAGFPTGIKQQVVRLDREQEVVLSSAEVEELRRAIGRAGLARAAVLSDYGYGSVTPDLLPEVRKAVGKEGAIIVDSRFRLGDFAGLDGATPNEEEAETLLGRPLDDASGSDILAGCELRDRLGARFLLITRGSRGMSLFTRDGAAHVPVHGTDQVADVTGAGDTVIGTFALALAAGGTPLEAMALANYAGGVVVMKMGTATVSGEELQAAISADPRPRLEMTWAAS